jgi:hypothetical protein
MVSLDHLYVDSCDKRALVQLDLLDPVHEHLCGENLGDIHVRL